MAEQKSKVIYDGKVLIPAPFISLARSTHRTEDGHGVGHTMIATLTGKVVSCKGWDFSGATPQLYTGSGYPPDCGNDCLKFTNILDMQMVIRETFRKDNEYHWFEIQSLECGPHPPKKWLARVQDVNFKEGLWVDTAEYTITLELVQSVQEYGSEDNAKEMAHTQHTEKWDLQFDPDNGCAYILTHTISCNAKQWAGDESPASIEDGWKLARKWVGDRLTQLGTEPTPKLDQEVVFDIGFLLDVAHKPYNYKKNESIDQLGGNYSVTETWEMAKSSVIHNYTTEYNRPRDGDFTVRVTGQFKSFLNAAQDNQEDCSIAFDAWETANGPFTVANGVYDGNRTLRSCPVMRVVNRTHQKRGDGTEVFCADNTRVVDFSYEFSDGGDPLCDIDINVTEKFSNVPAGAVCQMRTVSVDGNIQGHRCAGNEDSMLNANNCLSTLDPNAKANAAYTGARTLALLNQSISKNARKSTIQFGYEYTDEYDASGMKKVETVVEGWNCEQRGSDGTPTVSHQIDGTIEALCSVDFADILAAVPDPSSYGITCGLLVKKSINKDEIHKRVGYSYTFNEECGIAIVHTESTTKNGPDKCDITYITVQVQIEGIGCDDALATANAATAFNNLNTSGFAPVGYCRTSLQKTVNNTGKINAQYDYSSAGDAETTITKTESYDSADCGIKKTSIQGNIKGCCGAVGGAFAAAQTAYAAINPATLCTGYIVSRSKTENEAEGTIGFSFECQDRPDPYIEEKTITTRCDMDQPYTIVNIEGSITPLCLTDVAAQIVAAEAGWTTILGTLPGLASSVCTTPGATPCVATAIPPVLKRSSITRSKTNGKISYQYEYACIPCQRVAGTIEESIEIQMNRGGDSVAIVPILGRICGPLIQNKNTKKESGFSVTITFRFKPNCCSLTKPAGIETAVQDIISSVQSDVSCPVGCSVTNTYVQSDTENWSPCSGRYTRTIAKLLECC